MILKGELNLKYNNDDYIMFCGGRLADISEILYSMYIDKAIVEVKISRSYDKKVLFSTEGELYKNKIQPKYYVYYIGDECLDNVLWNLVNNKIIIEIKNISKN